MSRRRVYVPKVTNADVSLEEVWNPSISDFPFWEEEDLEAGPVPSIPYFCWDPDNVPQERMFPFHELALEESIDILRDVIPHGNVSKMFPKHSQEYLSMSARICCLYLITNMPSEGNYVRGQTFKQLRTASAFKRVMPGALRKFLDLPLELLFDILELVHPIDLLHLSRSTKQMNQVLTMPRAKEIWAASYNNHADTVPSSNPTIPPLKWTAMLYASAVCDVSGSDVDWCEDTDT